MAWCEVHQRDHPPRKSPCRPVPEPTFIGPTVHTEVVDTAGWVGVAEHRRVGDQVLLDDVLSAAETVAPLLGDRVIAAMATMASWGDDTVRAQATDPGSGGQPMWCWAHERRADGRGGCGCAGEPYHPGVDPAGEAAAQHVTVGDPRPIRELARVRQLLALRARVDDELAQLVPRYIIDVTDEARWCPSCRRFQGHKVPAERRPDGRLKYSGRCDWCEDIRRTYGELPTLELLAVHFDPRVRRIPKRTKDKLMGRS